jgi:hypothetical protein
MHISENTCSMQEISNCDGYERLSARVLSSALETLMAIPKVDEKLGFASCESAGVQLVGGLTTVPPSRFLKVRSACVVCKESSKFQMHLPVEFGRKLIN